MIYKPRCEYSTQDRRGGALQCTKVNGYCAFQYRCELTGQYENTPTARNCKARLGTMANQMNQPCAIQTEQMTQTLSPAPAETGKEIAASITTHPDIDVNSERSHVNDAVEQPDNQTKRNPRTAKRGRRKKSADVSADAAQTGAD